MRAKRAFKPVYREIRYDSPINIYPRVRSTPGFLLESAKFHKQIGRYSFIGIDPYLVFRAKDGLMHVEYGGKKTVSSGHPLARLRELVGSYSQLPVEGLPPFQGGAAGLLAYDFVQYLERLPKKADDDLRIPDAHFFMIDRLIAFDHILKKAWVIVCPAARKTVPGYPELEDRDEDHINEAEACIENIVRQISLLPEQMKVISRRKIADFHHDTEKTRYISMVEQAKEYIAAGDIFQTNLSLRLSADIGNADPWDIYLTLREINPSPFAAYMDFGEYQIVSSSPERLVRVRNRVVDTRPIAGTRPRGKDMSEDGIMRAELLLNEKERAEHIMLIDLERNDLGRISDYGSVHVDELMVTEDYSHVIHIVSNISGTLVQGKDAFNVIRAVFPGGTITGVPKVRCMEIIDELEEKRRGPYTGSAGYVGFNGNVDLNIIIRTFLIKDKMAYIQAGAGIVADSVPEREYQESMKKAEALMKTLERL